MPNEAFPPSLAQPALRALTAEGYGSLDQLTAVTEKDLAKLHGMGPNSLRILREALEQTGRSFASE